jgi:redox-sensitive bicupin YhaK (pirin superfamily)
MHRKVIKVVKGRPAIDGAGVHLTRVLGAGTMKDFDPFVMLDSFDSTDPADYMAGFPMHPHRGIETLTYMVQGEMAHRDSMGNSGVIRSGQAQWMTAGSGILHEEMPQEKDRMLGFQLWINLPAKDKMTRPHYQALDETNIGEAQAEDFKVRVLSGEYMGAKGFTPLYVQARVLDFAPEKDATIEVPAEEDHNAFIFLLLGDVEIDGKAYDEKSAILLSRGDTISFKSLSEGARVIVYTAPKLEEPVAWGGPIVMNSQEELEKAFDELNDGSFIKHKL